MSLIVHLPLNKQGDLRNKGLAKVTVTNYGATYSNNGKLGGCYTGDPTQKQYLQAVYESGTAAFFSKYINNHSFSLAAWSNSDAQNTLVSISYGVMLQTGLFQCNTSTAFRIGNNTADGKWHHYCGTYDVDTGIMTMYVDGVQTATGGRGSYTSPWTTYGIGIGRNWNASNATADFYMNKGINDVRIYDHCLSPKEVKELSKGLILHYPLDDAYIEGARNIFTYPKQTNTYTCSYATNPIDVSGWSSGKNTGVTDPDNGTHAYWKLIEGIPTMVFPDTNSSIGQKHRWLGIYTGLNKSKFPANTTYTVSFDAKADVAGKRIATGLHYTQTGSNSYAFNDGTKSVTITTSWERYNVTFTCESGAISNPNYYFYGHYGTEGTAYIRNAQLEINSHATPYTTLARNTNLVTGLTAGGQTAISDDTVTISGENKDTYFYLNLAAPLITGREYKISCTGSFASGVYYNFPIGGQSNTSMGLLKVQDGDCELTFVANAIYANSTRIIIDDTTRSAGAGTITNFKLEEIPVVCDCSGYNNNGTVKGILSCSDDGPRHKKCTYFSAKTNQIVLPTIQYSNFGSSYTFSWWSKASTSTLNMMWGFSDGNRFNLFDGLNANTGDGYNNPFYKPGTTTKITNPWDNTFKHYAITGDGTATKLYVNGEHYGTAKTFVPLTGTLIYINGWSVNSVYGGLQYMSDFRIYTTALSDDNIKDLYETAAVIDNYGSDMCYEFEETGTSPAISKTGVTSVGHICERQNLFDKSYAYYRNSSITWTADDAATIVTQTGARYSGFQLIQNAKSPHIFPYGMRYVFEFDVYIPKTTILYVDQSNAPVSGSAWNGNDNDNDRLTNWEHSIPANTWTHVLVGGSNTNTLNIDQIPLFSYDVCGIDTTSDTESITYYVKNIKYTVCDSNEECTYGTDYIKANQIIEI